MISELLDTVYEYQLLRAKERMQIELGLPDKVRASALRQCLRGDFVNGQKRRCNRFEEPPQVHFTYAGGFGEGRLHDICGSGVAIETTCQLKLSNRTVLRICDVQSNAEYVFPARVVWRAQAIVGLAFDGAPSRIDDLAWSWSSLRLNRQGRHLVA